MNDLRNFINTARKPSPKRLDGFTEHDIAVACSPRMSERQAAEIIGCWGVTVKAARLKLASPRLVELMLDAYGQ